MQMKRFNEAKEVFAELFGSLEAALKSSPNDHKTVSERIHHAVDLRETGKVLDAVAFLTDLPPLENAGAPSTVRAAAAYLTDVFTHETPDVEQWIGLRLAIESAWLADYVEKLDGFREQLKRLRAEHPVPGVDPSRTSYDNAAQLDMLDRHGR